MKNYVIRLRKYIKKHGVIRTVRRLFQKIQAKINKTSAESKLEKEEKRNYRLWIKNNEPNEQDLQQQREMKFGYEPKISIIVPMYNTPYKYFKELFESLANQTYSNWELCLADGSSQKAEYLKQYEGNPKIKYRFLNKNNGIADNTNEAIKLADGDYLGLLDHDDTLPIFSLFEVVKVINENPDVDLIYSDEDKITDEPNVRLGPHFKPDYAPDTLLSYNYICHFSVYRKELMDKLGGLNNFYNGSQDYDLILRAAENTDNIIHIPKVLYHWRINPDSVALSSDAKPYAYTAAKKAIKAHLDRKEIEADVSDTPILGLYRVKYKIRGNPKISIIIPNKDHIKDLNRCIRSILRSEYHNYEIIIVENNSVKPDTFEYYNRLKKHKRIKVVKYAAKVFNYSKINNFGVENSDGEYLVFLNNDIEIHTTDWLEVLLGTCQREDVGIVGARLIYPDSTIQHAGVVLGLTGVAGHVNAGEMMNKPGYMGRVIIQQNYSAVTAALMMMKRKTFIENDGFSEEFPVAYNDIDLCLKVRDNKKLIVYEPNVIATHFESQTRGYENTAAKQQRLAEDTKRLKRKWRLYFNKPDPYFNINFRKDTASMRIEPGKVRERV